MSLGSREKIEKYSSAGIIVDPLSCVNRVPVPWET